MASVNAALAKRKAEAKLEEQAKVVEEVKVADEAMAIEQVQAKKSDAHIQMGWRRVLRHLNMHAYIHSIDTNSLPSSLF